MNKIHLLIHERFFLFLSIFICLNIGLYCFISLFHSKVEFNSRAYRNVQHYLVDPQIQNKSFNLVKAMGQMDGQWYLKIAAAGYPAHPSYNSLKNTHIMDGPTYAFFPLYPLLIKVVNLVFHNIELSAFILSNFLLLVSFISLYFLFRTVFPNQLLYKSLFFLFFYPFSIFYRSYFTEGLYLLILIWLAYFLIEKNLFWAGILLALLNITKANGFLLNLLFLATVWNEFKNKKINFVQGSFFVVLIMIPFISWMIYCYWQTGNALFFLKVRSAWLQVPLIFIPLYNLYVAKSFWILPFHSPHMSKLEIISVIITLIVVITSRKKLKPELWWISVCLWLSPLLVTDTMSFSRYQTVSFPLFIYLSTVIKGKWYFIMLASFLIGLCWLSLYFVNWYWIG